MHAPNRLKIAGMATATSIAALLSATAHAQVAEPASAQPSNAPASAAAPSSTPVAPAVPAQNTPVPAEPASAAPAPAASQAGTQDQATPEAPQGVNLGGDIVVTAQRRTERLQDVPVAVTAFTETMIQDLHLNDAISVSKFVPSMISQHNAGLASANAYYLRGLGNSQSVATFDPPVGTYVDDVYVARQNANNYAFFDTERVEVLRGPQGTLFGRNTTVGAVSVIMRKPSTEYGAKAEVTVGSYDRVTAKATIDAPISDQVLTKVSGFYVTDGGYLKNITTGDMLNGETNYGVRGDVRFLPTDRLTIDLSGEFTSNTGTYLGMQSLPTPSGRFRTTTTPIFYETAAGLPATDCNRGPAVDTLLEQGAGNCALSESYAVTGTVNYELEAGTLTGIFGYRKLNQHYINQYPGNVVNKYNAYLLTSDNFNEQFSGELKWAGDAMGGRLTYVAGLFYLQETTTDFSADFQNGTPGATSFNLLQDRHFFQKVQTAAAYLQADYEVVPSLTVTLGGRFTHEEKNLEFFRSERFPGFGFNSEDAIAAGIPLTLTENRFTPRIAVNYKVNPNVMLFASATNGFKSGGWNGNSATPARVLPFRPEITWSYEAGIKSELFNRRVRFNANVYLADTQDIQITSGIIPPGETAIVSLARNAGTLRAYGLEWETAFAVTNEFNFFINGSLNHGEYTKIVLTPGVAPNLQVQEGTEPVRIPKFQLASGATYRKAVDALDGSLGATVAYRHNSPYWIALLNTAQAPTENFVDVTLSYENFGGDYGVSFDVSNLTKQETITANFLSLFPGAPRRFTGRLWFKF